MNRLEPTKHLELFGRQTEFQRITQVLARDGDLLIAGVPGSGRRTLVHRAVQEVGAKHLEVDCIRATNSLRFLQLLCAGMNKAFKSSASLAIVGEWLNEEAKQLFTRTKEGKLKTKELNHKEQQWLALKLLLQLPQRVAQSINRQIAIVFLGFPHIRSWDRHGTLESYLREEIKSQTEVSYVLVTTMGEMGDYIESNNMNLEVVKLMPLADDVVAAWVQHVLRQEKLTFNPRTNSLNIFLNSVQGHLGDASSVMRRLSRLKVEDGLINEQEVEQTLEELVSDLSNTFESLLVLLPANQAHLLECLALEPTDKPQSREYRGKHYLPRGGSLQGAIASLQHKGLIYGADLGYKIALPLLSLWIRQRLS